MRWRRGVPHCARCAISRNPKLNRACSAYAPPPTPPTHPPRSLLTVVSHSTLCLSKGGHEGRAGTFGRLSSVVAQYKKEDLVEKGIFNEHAVYSLGEPLLVPETGLVTVALSTENLLLNAYRQSCQGLPCLLCVDTTHRLVVEGHCCSAPLSSFGRHTIARSFVVSPLPSLVCTPKV